VTRRSDITCGSCDRKTAGAVLCDHCQTTFRHSIVNVGIYYTDLDTIATKRARYGSSGATKGSIGKTVPLPLDGRFAGRTSMTWAEAGQPSRQIGRLAAGAQLSWDTSSTVIAWTTSILAQHPPIAGPSCPASTACLHTSCAGVRRRPAPGNSIPSMINYLAHQFSWLVNQPWAPAMLDEFLNIEARLGRFVDRPADRWYAGKCSATDDSGNACTVELYAQVDRGWIDCKACATRHDVATRRDFLLTEAQSYLVTATEAAGALLAWTDYDGTEDNLIDRIRKWADRDRLAEHGTVVDQKGRTRSLYRLGDVQQLLIGHAQREQQRRLAK
jgi:hypothetical protein